MQEGLPVGTRLVSVKEGFATLAGLHGHPHAVQARFGCTSAS